MEPEWDDFTEEAKAASGRRQPCTVELMLDVLPDLAQRTIVDAMNRKELSNSAIGAALRKRLGDDAPSDWTIGKHRRKHCACWRANR